MHSLEGSRVRMDMSIRNSTLEYIHVAKVLVLHFCSSQRHGGLGQLFGMGFKNLIFCPEIIFFQRILKILESICLKCVLQIFVSIDTHTLQLINGGTEN